MAGFKKDHIRVGGLVVCAFVGPINCLEWAACFLGAAAVVGSSGCSLLLEGQSDGDDEREADAGIIDGAAAAFEPCEFSIVLAGECGLGAPMAPPEFEPRLYLFDTDTGQLSADSGLTTTVAVVPRVLGSSASAIWYVESFDVPSEATVEVTGTRALVIVSQTTIDIAGVLDVSSDGSRRGPGLATECGTSASGSPGSQMTGGGSGGGGGGFYGGGGPGGTGDSDGVGRMGGLAGGGSDTLLVAPSAGCDGGGGGFGDAATQAAGGAGGGALQLIARVSIRSEQGSRIDASGGGGGGGGAGWIAVESTIALDSSSSPPARRVVRP